MQWTFPKTASLPNKPLGGYPVIFQSRMGSCFSWADRLALSVLIHTYIRLNDSPQLSDSKPERELARNSKAVQSNYEPLNRNNE